MSGVKRQVLLWATLFLFLVALVLHSRQLFHMATAMAVLWPTSRLLARSRLRGLQVVRVAPQALHAGEVGQVSLHVTNPGSTRRLFVQVRDRIPAQAAGEPPRFVIPLLEGGSTTQLKYTLHTGLRGVYRLGPALLEASDTLGLSQFTRSSDMVSEVVVYPTPVDLPMLWPLDGGGQHARRPMPALGEDGLEFHGIRSYVAGDDPRRIHWKTSARTGELMTMQMAREQSLRGVVILDLFRANHTGTGLFSTLEQSVLLAASAARQAQSMGADIGLIAVGDEDYSVPIAPGAGSYHTLLDALARVQTGPDDNWPDALVMQLASLPSRSSALVISPRTDPTALLSARHLIGRGHRLSWVVLSASEHAPPEIVATLQAVGCQVRVVDWRRPLAAQLGVTGRFYARTY